MFWIVQSKIINVTSIWNKVGSFSADFLPSSETVVTWEVAYGVKFGITFGRHLRKSESSKERKSLKSLIS